MSEYIDRIKEISERLLADGKVDMVSIYRSGKLVRREILNPEVVQL